MTPAVKAAQRAKINYTLHEYDHDPNVGAYGLEAAEALGISHDQIFKTLVVSLSGAKEPLAVGIVPVSTQLDLKSFAVAAHAKKAVMADAKDAKRATGYVLGGISPLGQRRRLPTLMDESALKHRTIYVSAGKRGLQIELAPGDLIRLCAAVTARIGR
ncbi:MAG: Cys-tRNA(Pro) deacylase [Thermodesulfobacteriota bacterium]